MTVEFTLAAIVSLISLSLAVASWLRTRRGDWTQELKELDAERKALARDVRILQDAMLSVQEFMRQRASLPDRIEQLERRLLLLDMLMKTFREDLPKILADISRGRHQ